MWRGEVGGCDMGRCEMGRCEMRGVKCEVYMGRGDSKRKPFWLSIYESWVIGVIHSCQVPLPLFVPRCFSRPAAAGRGGMCSPSAPHWARQGAPTRAAARQPAGRWVQGKKEHAGKEEGRCRGRQGGGGGRGGEPLPAMCTGNGLWLTVVDSDEQWWATAAADSGRGMALLFVVSLLGRGLRVGCAIQAVGVMVPMGGVSPNRHADMGMLCHTIKTSIHNTLGRPRDFPVHHPVLRLHHQHTHPSASPLRHHPCTSSQYITLARLSRRSLSSFRSGTSAASSHSSVMESEVAEVEMLLQVGGNRRGGGRRVWWVAREGGKGQEGGKPSACLGLSAT